MNLKKEEIIKEENYLQNSIKEIKKQISSLGQELYTDQEKVQEFKKFIWENKGSLDKQELKSMQSDSDLEIFFMIQKGKYFQKLYIIEKNPYFGSIIFEEDNDISEIIYIGITHLVQNEKHLIHDWRSPICSLFYDYEIGRCFYKAPEGIIKGDLKRKRQYKIKDSKLVHVFDNSLSINDELLQEVLANESSEKMKNIVNTIQEEQNKVIRNTEDKNLIVQGIAGSGKTSVALHRIAFLLYRLENLSSNNVLIFSPNNIFTEYISNVLPELGEDNTMQTTFQDFLYNNIIEYKGVGSFIEFIAGYYKGENDNPELTKYKQSDTIIEDINNYINELVTKTEFTKGITDNFLYDYSKEKLNELLHDRYEKFPLFNRIKEISIKFSENNYKGKRNYALSFMKKLHDSLNIKKDYKEIYASFFKSKFSKIKLSNEEIKKFVYQKKINYEDACLFVYIKGLLEGFDYNSNIKEIVIDEAQDYNKLQYIIISKIFKKASLTILGDINQTINPYYKYNTLKDLSNIFKGSVKYLELTKTYRSTAEIISYTNKILNLNHVSAIRRETSRDVTILHGNDNLIKKIKDLRKEYKSLAIITKDDSEAEYVYKLLKPHFEISLIDKNTEKFKKDFIIIPAYIAKGLEFDAVIVYSKADNTYRNNEKYLFYVACTRAQHELIIFN